MRARLVLLLALLPGCALVRGNHWDEARQNDIAPINTAIHRHLPGDIKAKNLDAVLAIYAVDEVGGLPWDAPIDVSGPFAERRLRWQSAAASEPVRRRYELLFDTFDTIDRAEVRIHRVYWEQRDADGYPAEVRLLVRGHGPDGSLRMLDQRARIALDRRQGEWRITRETVTARELLITDGPAFAVATEAAGLADVHSTDGSPPFRLLGDIAASSGVAVADVDCDGYEDVALLSTDHVRLFRSNADGTFSDASAARGLGALDTAAAGLVFFDADNDGDPDLWITGIRGDRFFRNEGCRGFADATAAARIAPDGRWGSMPLIADYDRDGWLDVYVVRMGDHETTAPTPNWQAQNGVPDTLYRNNGDGTFSDATDASGIEGTSWGLAGAWGDYDGDGWPDVYVGNEFGTNALYHNNGDGTFTDVAAASGTLDRGAAMGVAWGDVDNDGDLDLFVANMYANSRWALFHPEFPAPVPWYFGWVPRSNILTKIDELSRGSTLLRNNGDGTFTDVSDAAGVRDAQWGWGTEFLDYNGDGRLDVYAANGFITGPIPDDV